MSEADKYEAYYRGVLEKIASERERRGLTKKEMADRIGMHQMSYGMKESGKQRFSFPELLAIADVLQIDLTPRSSSMVAVNEDVLSLLVKSLAEFAKSQEEFRDVLQEIVRRLDGLKE